MGIPRLTIAIDETGHFCQQLLQGREQGVSGMAAVLCSLSDGKLTDYLSELAQQYHLQYPTHFHAMELLNNGKRYQWGLRISQKDAEELVDNLRRDMRSVLDDVIGVHGRLPGQKFFHEQQAYGETLLALLHLVGEKASERLAEVQKLKVILATRAHPELTGFGFSDVHEYHDELARYLEKFALKPPWPKHTKIVCRKATSNPYLIVADFFASFVSKKPSWSTQLTQTYLPSATDVAIAHTKRIDRVSALLLRIICDEDVSADELKKWPEQTAREAIRRLTAAAHSYVMDRHGQGSIENALKLIEFLWTVSTERNVRTIQSELCTIASEIMSHRGFASDSSEVRKWHERAEMLSSHAWATNYAAARASRLEHRCQTVQHDSFNVFAFEDVYYEFQDYLSDYEQSAGGPTEISSGDELYGKLLGTLGQACGFLRAQAPEVGEEAWNYLIRSGACFRDSDNPLFRTMNLGYRLTDLWDREEFTAAQKLMRKEKLPRAREAGAYALLHRLRITSALQHKGEPGGSEESLCRRLLNLLRKNGTDGQTPWDLCLKWAVFLDPNNENLKVEATKWVKGIDTNSVAILATSLPLFTQLGLYDQAQNHLEILLKYEEFAKYWNLARPSELRYSIEDHRAPSMKALMGMPWNYS